jgi:predicted O-methyltransferase YrrM
VLPEDKVIREVFHVKRGDTLPYTPWGGATRENLLQIFARLGYTRGAEIGVAEGRFSEAMHRAIPGLQLMSVDPWAAYGRISQRICDERYNRAVARLGKLEGVTIVRKTSMEAARDVPDGSLDFVYIDADHSFRGAMLDILLWTPKVRRGGIVSGHDFYEFYGAGVVTAVEAYVRAHAITDWYITREKEASWLWVQR